MVERHEQGAAFFLIAQAIQAHGIQALEDVFIIAVARRMAVLLNKTLNVFEAGNDALLARSAAGLLA